MNEKTENMMVQWGAGLIASVGTAVALGVILYTEQLWLPFVQESLEVFIRWI